MNQFVKEYKESKVIVVCRGIAEEEIVNVAQAMYDGGIRFMEVPFNQADPSSFADTARKIKAVREAMDGKMHVGAGTVITMEQFEIAKEAGAEIIVSPTMEEDVIVLGYVVLNRKTVVKSECLVNNFYLFRGFQKVEGDAAV